MARLRAAHRRSRVEVWGHDQARRGLKPIVRKVWARRGQRPRAVSTHRYEWTYASGFVHPKSGKTQWLLLPAVSTAAMGLALAAFARAERAGPRKHVVVGVDRAAWHTTPRLPVPRGLHLVSLPAATPELQPAERLWPLLNEGIANRSFPTPGLLERALARRCRQLIEQRALIRNLTCYHWWPDC